MITKIYKINKVVLEFWIELYMKLRYWRKLNKLSKTQSWTGFRKVLVKLKKAPGLMAMLTQIVF